MRRSTGTSLPGDGGEGAVRRVRELTDVQSRALFDRAARYYLDLSGEEFLERWESGCYEEPDCDPDVMSVVMLLPFARSGSVGR